MKPFEDKEKVEEIKKERAYLIEMLNKYGVPEEEKRFILKRIEYMSEKLLEKARYGK